MQSFLARGVRPRARLILVIAAIAFSGQKAGAQNAQAIMNMFGGMMGAAMMQQARGEWARVPPAEQSCFEAGLSRQGASLNSVIRSGVSPRDPGLAAIRAACDGLRSGRLRQNVECPISTAQGEFISRCDEGYVRDEPDGSKVRISLQDAAALAFSNEEIATALIERNDAQLRRVEMMTAGAKGGRVPTPNFDCAKARTQSELAICGSSQLSSLDSEYDALYRRTRPLDRQRVALREAKELYERGTACQGAQSCIKDTTITGINFMAAYLRNQGLKVTTSLDQSGDVAHAQPTPANGPYYYVANVGLPDAYLSLRTDPSSSTGRRIATMPNGTTLDVQKRRSDGWWYVHVLSTGQEGWALSGQAGEAWIECCAYINPDASNEAVQQNTGEIPDYASITSPVPAAQSAALQVNPSAELCGPHVAVAAAIRVESCTMAIARLRKPQARERAFNRRGLANMELHQYTEAVKDFTEVVHLNPKVAGYFDNRQNAFKALDQLPSALHDANEAVRLAPKQSFVYASRGNIYSQMGKYDLAIQDYTTAISIDPRDTGLIVDRGKSLVEAGRIQDGIADFTRALAADPNQSAAMRERGLAYIKTGDINRAHADLNTYFAGHPNDDEAKQALQGAEKQAEKDKVARLGNVTTFSKTLIDEASSFLKSNPANPNTLAIAEAIATADAALSTGDPDQIEKTASDLSRAVHNDAHYAGFVQARAERRAEENNRHLNDAIRLATQQREFLTRYIAENPTTAAAASFIANVKELDTEIAGPDLDRLRRTTDDVDAALIQNNLHDQFLTSLSADTGNPQPQASPALSLATTNQNRFLMSGNLRDIVLMYNSSAQAPHVAKNLRGDIVFSGDTASSCFFQKSIDDALFEQARAALAPYRLNTLTMTRSPCASNGLQNTDVVIVRRGDFLRQEPAYASELLKDIELGHFKLLSIVTQEALTSEGQAIKARRERIEADVEAGAANGFGILFLTNSTAQSICAAVASQKDGHQRLLAPSLGSFGVRIGARPTLNFTPIETAFHLVQTDKCGAVYASAADLKELVSALKRDSIAFEFGDVWFVAADVDKAQSKADKAHALAEQQAADRREHVSDEEKLARLREGDEAATKPAREAALRRQYGQIAAATAATITNDVKHFTDGAADDRFSNTFPQFAAWYAGLMKDHWQLISLNSDVADYGSVVWKQRKLEAGVAKVSVRFRSSVLGEYKDACFDFGWITDDEFHMERDPFETPCDSQPSLTAWEDSHNFESEWIVK